MTREERMRAYELRLKGNTWAQIAQALGYSENATRVDMYQSLKTVPRPVNTVYPRIERYLREHEIQSITAFARMLGVHYHTALDVLHGDRKPSKNFASLVERVTGIPGEEAFKR